MRSVALMIATDKDPFLDRDARGKKSVKIVRQMDTKLGKPIKINKEIVILKEIKI